MKCASIRRASRWSRSITSSISAAPSSWCCARLRTTSKPACRSATPAIASIRDQRSALPIPRSVSASSRFGTIRMSTRRIIAYARDAAGNEVTTPLEHQPFVKKFVQSKIPIDQKFLDRVVPAIASNTPDLKIDTGTPDGLLKGFLEINGNLRKKNGDFIASLAAEERAAHAVDRSVRADGEFTGRVAIRRSAHVLLRRQGNRQAGAPRLRPGDGAAGAGARLERRTRGVRGLPRHLRQLRDHRSRSGRAVALCAHVDDWRQGGRFGDEGPGARTDRINRAGRRRSSPLHDAAAGHAGESGGVVGSALAAGSRDSKDYRGGRDRLANEPSR